jgi:Tfp pilus assembly pilus retraction ATPase PilT
MQTMEKSLAELVRAGKVKREEAEERASDKAGFLQLVGRY